MYMQAKEDSGDCYDYGCEQGVGNVSRVSECCCCRFQVLGDWQKQEGSGADHETQACYLRGLCIEIDNELPWMFSSNSRSVQSKFDLAAIK